MYIYICNLWTVCPCFYQTIWLWLAVKIRCSIFGHPVNVMVFILDGNSEIVRIEISNCSIPSICLVANLKFIFKKDMFSFSLAHRVLSYHLISKYHSVRSKSKRLDVVIAQTITLTATQRDPWYWYKMVAYNTLRTHGVKYVIDFILCICLNRQQLKIWNSFWNSPDSL